MTGSIPVRATKCQSEHKAMSLGIALAFVILGKNTMQAQLNKEHILQILAAQSRQLERYGVLQIGLFGSFLHGNTSENSDIDLLVDIKKEKKTLSNFLHLNYYLEDLFGRKVELVTVQSLSPYIGPHILKEVTYASFPG